MYRVSIVLGLVVCGGVACHRPMRVRGDADDRVPLFAGMGTHARRVTTSSPEAQKYFNQGLVWTFAFNHDEAIRSFTQAARLDPDCAMAWWGIALCHGPHINNAEVTEASSLAACEALQKALASAPLAGAVEQELITALSKRYACPPPADRKPLDQAYATAMREVWKRHPTDTDIGILYAEAMMDLRPWDLWTKDGKAQPGTEEIVAVLEEVLRLDPAHPGANHLYIHAVEASPQPLRALTAADRLRNLVPSAGHLVHMPAHIDIHAGQWKQASDTNERAIKADQKYRALSPKQDFYRMYMAHNHQFLTFSMMMEGRSNTALKEARAMVASIPSDWAKENMGIADGAMLYPIEVQMRFGRWDDVLREPAPATYFPIATSFWHFARGIAYAAQGHLPEAEREQAAFREAVKHVPQDARVGNSPAYKVLTVAEQMLVGEVEFRRRNIDASVAALRKAIAAEDDLNYDEPPDWLQPVRHTLGAVLVSAGRYPEAEAVYREDLKRWPENGWSLYGLASALRRGGSPAEADRVEKRFREAWKRADVRIGSSCLCVTN